MGVRKYSRHPSRTSQKYMIFYLGVFETTGETLGGEPRGNSLLFTWKLTFDHISLQRPRAAQIFSFMIVLDRCSIPLEQTYKRFFA